MRSPTSVPRVRSAAEHPPCARGIAIWQALAREKDAIESQLTATREDWEAAQQTLQQTQAAQHREIARLHKELSRARSAHSEATAHGTKLQQRVDELKDAVPASKNVELITQLRRTQAELLDHLERLKAEGGFEPPRSAEVRSPASSQGGRGEGLIELSRSKAEVEEMRAHVAALEQQLAASKVETSAGGADAKMLVLQLRALKEEQAQFELERADLVRRAAFFEEQRNQLQRYVDANLAPLQREVLKLRQRGQ